MAGLLSGCANDCNILSGNQSLGCQVVLGGGFLLTAPFLLPIEEAKRAARQVEEKDDYLKVKAGVTNGDVDSLKSCVLRCNYYLVFMEEKHQLRDEAARKMVALDYPTLPQEQVEVMMVAYWLLAREKSTDGDWRLNSRYVARGWALARRYEPADPLDSTHEKTLSDLAQYIFILYLRSLPEHQIQQALDECVIQDKLPKHPYERNRDLMCEWAYEKYMEIQNPAKPNPKVPKELEDKWFADNMALERARYAKPSR